MLLEVKLVKVSNFDKVKKAKAVLKILSPHSDECVLGDFTQRKNSLQLLIFA